MKKYIIPLAMLTLVPTVKSMAQDDKPTYNESVMVVSEYKPEIDKSQRTKLNVAPRIVDTIEIKKGKTAFDWNVPNSLNSLFTPSSFSAAKVREPIPVLYNWYVRGGVGVSPIRELAVSPLLDINYNSLRNKNVAYGGRFYHQSQFGRMGKNDPNTVFDVNHYGSVPEAMTGIGLFGKYILKDKVEFSTDLGYENERGRYYGFNDSTLNVVMNALNGTDSVDYRSKIDGSSYRFGYNKLGWNLGAKSLNTDVNQFGYKVNANISDLWATYNQNEMNAGLDGTAHYGFPVLKNSKGIVSLQAYWQHYRNSFMPDTTVSGFGLPLGIAPANGYPQCLITDSAVARNIFGVHPYIDFLFRGLNVHAGVNLAFDGYSQPDSAVAFKFFPDVVVSKSFMNNDLNFYFGFTGGMDAQGLDVIRQINPYVAPGSQMMAAKHYDLYAHMRLDFNNKLRLKARMDYSLIHDGVNFQLEKCYELNNVFHTVYQDYSRLRVGGDFSFINDELLGMELGANAYLYDPIRGNDLSVNAYRPSFDAHLNLNMDVKIKTKSKNYDKHLLVHGQALLLSRMTGEYMVNNLGDAIALDTLPMRFGLSLDAEYTLTRAVSVFARFDNIAARRYFYWANYPSRRITLMGGITWTPNFRKK